jgi:aspartate carbamoyltransferase catalytic subunit
MKLKYLIEAQQLDINLLFTLFNKADELKLKNDLPLKGRLMATLFYEPSTRTRLSFESAMMRLGGNVISTENAKEFSSAIKGESIEDTIRVVSFYCDCIVMRHYIEGASRIATTVTNKPIINAGDGSGQHPTQALLDVYTIWKELGKLDNIAVAIVGDLKYGRTVRSLCYLLAKFNNVKIIFISRKELEVNEDIKEYLKKHNVEYIIETDLNKNLPLVDIVYMTRIQKERMSEQEYNNAKGKYTIDDNNLKLLKPNARLLHPLPHTEEFSFSVETETNDKRIAYFRQSENGLYIRMALLCHLLE